MGSRFALSLRYIKEIANADGQVTDFVYGYHVDEVIELD